MAISPGQYGKASTRTMSRSRLSPGGTIHPPTHPPHADPVLKSVLAV